MLFHVKQHLVRTVIEHSNAAAILAREIKKGGSLADLF
jgi:hypothetical protein